MKLNTFHRLIMGAALIAGLGSCSKQEEGNPDDYTFKGRPKFGAGIEDVRKLDTKSVLTAGDIETRITGISLAAYSVSEGTLLTAGHFSSDFDRMELDLGGENAAKVYALANMGDMTSAFPANVSGVGDIVYTIPSFTGGDTSIETRGIPMAGMLDYDESLSTGTVIPLRRLLAKLAVDLGVNWPGTINTVQIKNMNRRMVPYGDSKALVSSDTFAEEIASGAGLGAGSFVFYVPENKQGTIPGITSSSDKSKDNSSVASLSSVLTYMEVTVDGSGKYEGTMTYRSYLGENATSDFNLVRNCRYTWMVSYNYDGSVLDDWKHENELAWDEWRYRIPRDGYGYISCYIGDDIYVILQKAIDRYEKGVLKSKGKYQEIDPGTAVWTNEEWSPGNFLLFNGSYNETYAKYRSYVAQREGSGYIRATVTNNERGTFTDRIQVYCSGDAPVVTLSASPTTIQLGQTVKLTVLSDGVDVTDDIYGIHYFLNKGRFTYSSSTGSVTSDYFHNYVSTDGYWTPEETGEYIMYCEYYTHVRRIPSNTVTIVVTEADEVSYILRITPTAPPAHTVGTSVTLKAWLDTYVNGSKTDSKDVTDDVIWSSTGENLTFLSAGVVTSATPGTYDVTANDTSKDLSATVYVSFTGDTNYITLTTTTSSINVGNNTQASVQWNGSTNVTAFSTIKAYTSETGSTESTVVSISSSGLVTGVSAGTCYLEAKYTTGGKTYTSARVSMTVVAPDSPLVIDWEGSAPTYVANRGKLTVTGLASDETVTGFTVTAGSWRVRLTPSGNSCYVGHLAAGSYTIQSTTSKGRTITKTGTVTAQTLYSSCSSLYVNPDGTNAHTETDGLTGNTLTVKYRAGSTDMTITTDQTAIGTVMQKDLYDELLEPKYETTLSSGYSAGLIHAGANGVWATDVYDKTDTDIATVKVSPKASSTGISSKNISIKPVNPFTGWSSDVTSLPDEQDYGLVSKYVDNNFSSHTFSYPAITASTTQSGIQVFRNGGTASSTFSSAFSVDKSSRKVTYQLTEAALSEHKGGLVELKGYVENKHSGRRMYHDGAQFGLYVNGAIGATIGGLGTGSVDIGTAFCGSEASYGFNMVSSYSFVKTDYSSGQHLSLWGGVSLSGIAEGGVGLNQRVYTFTLDNGTFTQRMVIEAEKPRFEFQNIGSLGVYVEDELTGGYYYLQPSGTPTVTDDHGTHGYYILHMLGNIQDKSLLQGAKQGWIIE